MSKNHNLKLSLLISAVLFGAGTQALAQLPPSPSLPLAGTTNVPCSQAGVPKNCLASYFSLAAPVNLAANSQWEIMSSEGDGTKWNIEGTGTMGAYVATGNTTGSNTVTFSGGGSTGEIKVGDLVLVSGTPVDAALELSPMRVIGVVANTSITVQAPLGLSPSASHPETVTPFNVGVLGSSGSGDAADGGWKKSTATLVWREDNAGNIYPGALYALAAHKETTGQEFVALTYPSGHVGTTGGWSASRYRNQTLTFGAWVYQKVRGGSGTWTVFIQSDGTGGTIVTSAAATTVGQYQWLTVTYTVPPDATSLLAGVQLNGANSDTYYISNPVLAVASALTSNSYSKPNELVIPDVHISPVDWINQSITFSTSCSFGYCFQYDNYAETNGAVAPTVTAVFGQLEGINTNTVVTGIGGSRLLAWYNQEAAPEISGGFLAQYVANVKSFSNAWNLPLNGSGYATVVTGVSGDSWTNVSMEEDWFFLQ